MLKKGCVLAIDGPDGVGKTVQVGLLKAYLEENGHTVHCARQSGETPIGEALRAVSLSPHERPALTDLHISLAMAAALATSIAAHKEKGDTIIIDRSPLAFIAYNTYGSQLKDKAFAFSSCVTAFKEEAIEHLFYLHAPATVLRGRLKQRGGSDYYESKGQDFKDRVNAGYAAGLEHVTQHVPSLKVHEIEASGSIESVHDRIVGLL